MRFLLAQIVITDIEYIGCGVYYMCASKLLFVSQWLVWAPGL